MMRAAEKDDQYASFVYEACRDAFRHLFGTRVAVAYQNETKLLGQMLYYVLTTGSGQQTLGEEYCDITQINMTDMVAIASRGIVLADSESAEGFGENAHKSHSAQISGASLSSSSGQSVTTLSRLKGKMSAFWLHLIQRWPTMLPFVRELLQLVLRANLMLFYFESLHYHISKRAAGIRYVFIGKASNQRPRYQILGVFLLIQLCIIAAEGLRRRNFTSITGSVHQASFATHDRSADIDKGSWVSESSSSELQFSHQIILRLPTSFLLDNILVHSPGTMVKLCLGDLLVMGSNLETISLHMQGIMQPVGLASAHFSSVIVSTIVAMYSAGTVSRMVQRKARVLSLSHARNTLESSLCISFGLLESAPLYVHT